MYCYLTQSNILILGLQMVVCNINMDLQEHLKPSTLMIHLLFILQVNHMLIVLDKKLDTVVFNIR